MRTRRRDDEDADSRESWPEWEAYRKAIGWLRPAPKLHQVNGRLVRLYQCPICRDRGLWSVDVPGQQPCAVYCPGCRPQMVGYVVARTEEDAWRGKPLRHTGEAVEWIREQLAERRAHLAKHADLPRSNAREALQLAQSVGAKMPGGDDGQ